jgi:hypothetical protein
MALQSLTHFENAFQRAMDSSLGVRAGAKNGAQPQELAATWERLFRKYSVPSHQGGAYRLHVIEKSCVFKIAWRELFSHVRLSPEQKDG